MQGILPFGVLFSYFESYGIAFLQFTISKMFVVDDRNIQIDEELQNWAELLCTPVQESGAGIRVCRSKGHWMKFENFFNLFIEDLNLIC